MPSDSKLCQLDKENLPALLKDVMFLIVESINRNFRVLLELCSLTDEYNVFLDFFFSLSFKYFYLTTSPILTQALKTLGVEATGCTVYKHH